jgi:hypothetical protein
LRRKTTSWLEALSSQTSLILLNTDCLETGLHGGLHGGLPSQLPREDSPVCALINHHRKIPACARGEKEYNSPAKAQSLIAIAQRMAGVGNVEASGGLAMEYRDSSQERMQQFEDELAALRAEVATLRAQAARPQRTGRGGHARSAHASGRRTLLKWAGAAAATAAVTALATEQSAKAAEADNGQSLILGQTNTAASTTY